MSNPKTAVGRKITMAKTKSGAKKVAGILIGLLAAGVLEQHVMPKIAFLADTKTGTDGVASKNTIGLVVKSLIYVAGGLVPGQLSDNDLLTFAGYGFAGYGAARGTAKLSGDAVKVFGLGGMYPHVDVPVYNQQFLSSGNQSSM